MIKRKKLIQFVKFVCMLILMTTVLSTICKKKNHPPTTPTTPQGAASTYTHRLELYTTEATDPDGNTIRFIWSMNDTKIDTTDENMIYYSWDNQGTYAIKVKAIDDKDTTSEWSSALTVTVVYNSPPTIDSIVGPGPSPLLTLPDIYIKFTTVARDSTDSVYVRYIHRKKSAASYTARTWIGPKASGSIFRDSIKFTSQDTYIVRSIAKDSKGSESADTSQPYEIIVSGPLWSFGVEDIPFNGSPALAQVDGEWLVFIGAGDGGDGYFYAISATNGSQKWQKKTIYDPEYLPPEPEDVFYASPAVNTYFTPPHVYCGGEAGELYCYKASSGSSWEWRFPDSSYDGLTYNEVSSSVAVSGNRLYVGLNCGYGNDYKLYAIQDNGSTCSVAWSYYTGIEIVSSPAVDATGNIFFGDDSGYVRCLNQNDGGEIWRWRISTGIYSVYASPAIGPNALYVGTDDGFLFALNRSNGTQIWRYPSTGTGLEGVRSSPVIGSDGTIYFGCDDGQLYAVTSNGQLKSGFPVFLSDGVVTSTPAIALDGTIVMYTEEDMVYGINPSGTIIWQVPLPGWGFDKKSKTRTNKSKLDDIIPSPTIGPDGRIYVASVQGGLFAIRGTTGNPLASTSWPKFRYNIQNTGKLP